MEIDQQIIDSINKAGSDAEFPNALKVYNGPSIGWVFEPLTDIPQNTAGNIIFTPGGTLSSTNVQDAIDELDAESVPTSRQVLGSGIATGGGPLNADVYISVPKASTPQAITGTDDTTVMTPLKVAQVISNYGLSTNASGISTVPAGNLTSTNVQSALNELDTKKIAKAGDTMTGMLVLAADPTSGLQAATKNYVDAHSTASGAAYILVSDTPPGSAADSTLWWQSSTGLLFFKYNDGNSSQWVVVNLQPDVSGMVQKTGDTMTGLLVLSGDPTAALGAVTKQYVDARVPTYTQVVTALGYTPANKAGDSFGGPISVTGAISATGNISGVAGTFTGALSAASATIGGNAVITAGNIGTQSVAAATNANNANTLRSGGSGGTPMTFTWSGEGGTPDYVWGAMNSEYPNMHVFQPANFSVNYANSAGSTTNATNATNLLSMNTGIAGVTVTTGSDPSSGGGSWNTVGTMTVVTNTSDLGPSFTTFYIWQRYA